MTQHSSTMPTWPGGPTGGPPGNAPGGPGPAGNRPSGPRRTGLIAAVVCGIAFCLVMVLIIAGGLIFLVVRNSAKEQIATVPLELEGIATVAPEEWTALDTDGDVSLDILAVRESPDTDERVTISRVVVELDATGICELLQDSAKEQGLATESVDILEPVMVDGVSALHYQWIGYSEERWQHSDAYCMDHSSGTVFLLAENSTDDEAAPTPAGELMLEEWRWTE